MTNLHAPITQERIQNQDGGSREFGATLQARTHSKHKERTVLLANKLLDQSFDTIIGQIEQKSLEHFMRTKLDH
eukprot:12925603-Prorocentrum_lima.AAC.1